MNLNRIRTYCGEPTEVLGAGFIYPVKLLEWDRFILLASKFLMTSDLFLRRRLELSEQIKLFDFITVNAIVNSSDGYSGLNDIAEAFSIVFRKEVKVGLRGKAKNQEVYFSVAKMGIIDRNNYDEVRKVIMEQNLMFDPIVAKDEKSQKIIDRGIERLRSGNPEVDIESMIVAVSIFKEIDLNNLTYYQLRADFEMISRIETNRAIPIYRANGADVEPMNLTQELSIHKNPYGADVLFRKRNDAETMDMLKL